jgi:hypothetical protein
MPKKSTRAGQLFNLLAFAPLALTAGAVVAAPACVGGIWQNEISGSTTLAGLGLREPGVINQYGMALANGSTVLPACPYASGAVRIPVLMADWADFDPLTQAANDNTPASTLPSYVKSSPLELQTFLQNNVSAYFRDVSGAALNINFEPFGWMRSDAVNAYLKPRASYLIYTNSSWICDREAMLADLVRDAIATNGADFGNYDLDGNGLVDGAVLLYKGGKGLCNDNGSSTLNHSVTATPAGFAWRTAPNDMISDSDPNKPLFATQSKIVNLFNTLPERSTQDGSQFTSATVWAHDLGQSLIGLPDYSNTRFNLGLWALSGTPGSASGAPGLLPSHPAAFEKWLFAKWITPQDISASGSYSVKANEIADGSDYSSGTYLYRIALDTPNHFLTVEGRWFDSAGNSSSRWANANGRESGLMITEFNLATDAASSTPVQVYRHVPQRLGNTNPTLNQTSAWGVGDVFYRCFTLTQCLAIKPNTAPSAYFGFDVVLGRDSIAPSVQMSAPQGVIQAVPYTFQWQSSDNIGIREQVLDVSLDGGSSYQRVPGCASMPGSAQSCVGTISGTVWATPSLRLTAYDYNNNGSAAITSLYVNPPDKTAPVVSVTTPANGRVLIGKPYTIAWTSSDNISVSRHDVSVSLDGGVSYVAVPGCSGLAGNVKSCTWSASGPAAASARFKVSASDASGNVGVNSASFALVAGSLTVSRPNTALTLVQGVTEAITWSSNLDATDSVKIELSRDAGSTWETVSAAAANTGSYNWTVAGSASTTARIRLSWNQNPAVADNSDVNFSIVTPLMVVTAPNTAVSWTQASAQAITWSSNLPTTSTVKVELSRDGGSSWSTVAASVPNNGTYYWSVDSSATTAQARLRVSSVQYPAVGDINDANFAIVAPSVTVTAPNTAVNWQLGSTQTITWSSNLSSSSSVHIDLSRDGGTVWESLATWVSATSSGYNWKVAGALTSAARIRVTSATAPVTRDISDVNFNIVAPTVSVTSGNTAQNWAIGSAQTINWSSSLPSTTNAKIELSIDGGTTWSVIKASTPNTGAMAWTVSATPTTAARIRVTSVEYPTVSDINDVNFTIAPAFINITTAMNGVIWATGTLKNFLWTSNLPSTTSVGIQLTRDNGVTWETMIAARNNSGGISWTMNGPSTNAARIRVNTNDAANVTAISDVFTIAVPQFAVTAPNGGEQWARGTNQTITWNSNVSSSYIVKVEVSRDGGTSWTTLTSGASNTGSFVWQVSGAVSSQCRFRISSAYDATIYDVSDANFSII